MPVKEVWKEIPGFASYQASSFGRIRSKERVSESGRTLRSRVLSQTVKPNGYLSVHMDDGRKRRRVYAHRAVAAAFHGFPDKPKEVNHINGKKADNRPSNLEWCSKRENARHAWETGLYRHKGERHWKSKLKRSHVVSIKRKIANGLPLAKIADEFGVTYKTIEHIKYGNSWKHVSA